MEWAKMGKNGEMKSGKEWAEIGKGMWGMGNGQWGIGKMGKLILVHFP